MEGNEGRLKDTEATKTTQKWYQRELYTKERINDKLSVLLIILTYWPARSAVVIIATITVINLCHVAFLFKAEN